jgi:hypothetical protein
MQQMLLAQACLPCPAPLAYAKQLNVDSVYPDPHSRRAAVLNRHRQLSTVHLGSLMLLRPVLAEKNC